MSKVLVLGATGALGGYVTQQAIAANHGVSTLVRTPSKLQAELRERVKVHQADLARTSASVLASLFQDHDVVINAAGHVAEGQVFVDLIARIVTGLESLPANDRPVCWFLGGAALLDLDDRGRRGVDLPESPRRIGPIAPISTVSARLHWTGEYCVRVRWSTSQLWVSLACGYRSTACPYASPRSSGSCPEPWYCPSSFDESPR